MMNEDSRCSVTSGSFRCDKAAGHEGEHECRPPARPWVGPAPTPLVHDRRLQLVGVAANTPELAPAPSAPPLRQAQPLDVGRRPAEVLRGAMQGDPPPEAA